MKHPHWTTPLKHTSLWLLLVMLAACSNQPKTVPPLPSPATATTSPAPPSSTPAGSSKDKEFSRPETRKPAPKDISREDYRQLLANIRHWQVQGKLGIRLPDNSGSLYYNWMQQPQSYAIHLSGPLGQGATWIRGNNHQVSITSGDKPPVFASTPEALMKETLGWSLPVEELYYWARGLASPNTPVDHRQFNDEDRLLQLHQSGWKVDYQRYKSFSGWSLPQKMVAEREGIRLTLIMKNWQIY